MTTAADVNGINTPRPLGWNLNAGASVTVEPGKAGTSCATTVSGEPIIHCLIDSDDQPVAGASWARLSPGDSAVVTTAPQRRKFMAESSGGSALTFTWSP